MPPNLDQHVLAIAGDLEGLVHDLGAMVADRAGRQLHAVADDVVLERLDVSGSCVSSASMPPWGMENGLWLKSILSSSFHSYIGKSVIQQNLKTSVFDQAELVADPKSRAMPANLAAAVFSPAEKNTASPALTPALAAMAACTCGRDELGDRPLAARAVFRLEDDVAEPRRAFRAPNR